MKQKNVLFLSFGLILLALCSCDKSVQTEADAAMAKARKRAMVQPSELGNFVVNPDLDAEFQVSEAEIVEELISYGFLDDGDPVDITPIYFERVIPMFFKSLIVEPESNGWYDINADEMMNMYFEFPSVAFYIINSASGKSFFTTANKRYACNLIEYRSPDYVNPELVTVQEDLINELYENGEIVSYQQSDSLWHARMYELYGVDLSDNRFQLTVCAWKLEVCNHLWQDYPCAPFGNLATRYPLLHEDMRWSQSDILLGCNHNKISGSIALSILKILCLSEYHGRLLDEKFDGGAYRSSLLLLRGIGRRLYEDINAAPNYTERGLEILNDCGFSTWTPTDVFMSVVRDEIDAERVVISENTDGSWSLLDGYKAQPATCEVIYKYDYDNNGCERSQYDWTKFCPNKVYYYENR